MRKRLFSLAGAAGLILGAAGVASAAVNFSVIDKSAQNGTNTANVFAPDYSAVLPAGASWVAAPTTRTGDIANITKSPFHDTPLQNVNTYWSTGPDNPVNPSILSFGPGTTQFSMLWGSVDSYNSITFTTSSGGPFVINGATVATALGSPPCADPANFECVALLSFTLDGQGETFTSASFLSDGANAFEYAFVPLPAAAWLLLGGLGSLGFVARRRKAAA